MSFPTIVDCGFKANGKKYMLLFGELDGTTFPQMDFVWEDNEDGTYTGVFSATNDDGELFECRTINPMNEETKDKLKEPTVVVDETDGRYYGKVTIKKLPKTIVDDSYVQKCFTGPAY